MIGVLYFFRLPPKYARKKSGEDCLHHLVARRLWIAYSGELHTIA
jgi:hypothetical protein